MATTPEAIEYMATLSYVVMPFPCERGLKRGRCFGCSDPKCTGFGFDEEHYEAAWLRLGELASEEVWADLTTEEKALFWFVRFAMEYVTNEPGFPKWTEETAGNYLAWLVADGEFERWFARLYEEANDPVLEDDDEYACTDG